MNDELNSQNAEITYPDALQLVIKKKKRCAYIVDGELYLRLGASDDEETRDGATLRNLRVRVRYFDAGTETIQIGWSINGTSETNTATIVTKTNTNKWKTAKYKFAAVLGGDQYPDQEYGDVRIVSTGELYVEYVITKDLDDGSEFVWSAATNATALATEDSESDDYEAGSSGWQIQRDTGNAEFNNITARGTIIASAGSIGGWTITATALYKDTGVDATSAGMSPSDYPFYAGATYANRANAPFRVTQAGAVTASNIDLAGGSVSGTFTVSGTLQSSAGNPRFTLTATGLRGYDSGGTQRYQILNDGSGWLGSSSVFSWTAAGVVSLNGSAVVGNSLDAGKVSFYAPTISGLTFTNNSPSAGYVAWSSFTLTYQGVSYTVTSGNSNLKYIYWKKSVSTTVLQASATIPANAADQFMVCVNFSGTAYPSNFAPFIYADYISVANLAAINADMGNITAGTITGGTIRTASSGARTEMNASNLFGLGFGGIGGTDGTTAQWYAKASDGKLYAAGGDWVVDASGQKLPVATSWDTKKGLRWETGGNVVSRLWSLSVDSTTNWTYLESVPAGSVTASEMLVASESSGTAIAIAILRARNGASTPADLRVYYNPSDARPNYAYVQGDLKTADGTYDLGVKGGAWRNAWVSGNVNAGGVLPYTNNADDIGSNSMRWQDVWIGGSGSVDIASGSGSRFKTNLQTAQIYVKSDKLVVHYRTAANQSRFYYITLTGTVNPTWTYSATEP